MSEMMGLGDGETAAVVLNMTANHYLTFAPGCHVLEERVLWAVGILVSAGRVVLVGYIAA